MTVMNITQKMRPALHLINIKNIFLHRSRCLTIFLVRFPAPNSCLYTPQQGFLAMANLPEK